MTQVLDLSPQRSRGRVNRNIVIGGAITLLVLALAILSFAWTPCSVLDLAVNRRLQPPSSTHLLGTDHFGRDIASMVMVGARNSIAVALVAVGIGVGLGVPLGLLAAARPGWPGEVLMRGNDIVFAFPALLSAVMITAVFGPGAVNAIIAIDPREVALQGGQIEAEPFAQGRDRVLRRVDAEHDPRRIARHDFQCEEDERGRGQQREGGQSRLARGEQHGRAPLTASSARRSGRWPARANSSTALPRSCSTRPPWRAGTGNR